jgi:heme oxygenase (mycobilin-producing)
LMIDEAFGAVGRERGHAAGAAVPILDGVTVVKINVIEVPDKAGPELERRFAAGVGEVEDARGFLGYEQLRPLQGNVYYSVSRWVSEEDFRAFVNSSSDDVRTGGWRGEAASGARLLEFDVLSQDSLPGATL